MSDFEYDVMQKKRIASQARYRKCGSKSKKCTLPSDMLTDKQLKERCGPVITYNYNKPMSWASFKELPTDVQTEYISVLQNRYGATAADLGRMFGVQALTVRKHVNVNQLNVEFPRGHAMSAAKKAEWERFLREEDTKAVEENISSEDEQESFTLDVEGTCAEPPHEKEMNMKKFVVQFSGAIDIDMIANSLKLILGGHAEGDIEIICNLE